MIISEYCKLYNIYNNNKWHDYEFVGCIYDCKVDGSEWYEYQVEQLSKQGWAGNNYSSGGPAANALVKLLTHKHIKTQRQ